MSDQEIHDLRGEIGGVREDIRALRVEVSAGFDRMNGRVRALEVTQIEARAREDERKQLLASGQLVGGARPPIHRDPRTYAVGGIGTAIGTILLEIFRVVATAPK